MTFEITEIVEEYPGFRVFYKFSDGNTESFLFPSNVTEDQIVQFIELREKELREKPMRIKALRTLIKVRP